MLIFHVYCIHVFHWRPFLHLRARSSARVAGCGAGGTGGGSTISSDRASYRTRRWSWLWRRTILGGLVAGRCGGWRLGAHFVQEVGGHILRSLRCACKRSSLRHGDIKELEGLALSLTAQVQAPAVLQSTVVQVIMDAATRNAAYSGDSTPCTALPLPAWRDFVVLVRTPTLQHRPRVTPIAALGSWQQRPLEGLGHDGAAIAKCFYVRYCPGVPR